MAKRTPRLIFTEDERQQPELKSAIKKADKKMDQLEKAEARVPKTTKKVKQRVVDAESGKVTTRLCFEEVDKKRPPSKLSHACQKAPLDTVRGTLHQHIREEDNDNTGVDAANTLTEYAEASERVVETVHHSHQEKPYRKAAQAERAADKANIHALEKEFAQQNGYSVNPYSKWQQKRAIKKEYAAAKAGKATGSTVKASQATKAAAKNAASDTRKAGAFFVKHKKGCLILGGIAALILIIVSAFSSCSILAQGIGSAMTSSSYPLLDDDMLAAEERYCAKEAELQRMLDEYELEHDYDEYAYELDEIGHDPYVLISALTALKGGPWTIDEIENELQLLFENQYILTEELEHETRHRMEEQIVRELEWNRFEGRWEWVEHARMEEVPYTYTACSVKLVNFNLSHVPVYVMNERQLSMYAMYMGALGNRPDIFESSDYVDRYYNTEYEDYEIPPEALEDAQFAAIVAEAEKYLGFPYVWGGSKPETSFDCSGFVSYVYNHCGLGWSFGRRTAQGLLDLCTRVSSTNVQPGDLIFFQGTYDTAGASHVGIYVGNNKMIHCGDPIQYASIDSSYWQSHFLAFGRMRRP